MLWTVLLVLLLLSVAGGAWGHSRWGWGGWSPVGVILAIFVVLWLTGNLHS